MKTTVHLFEYYLILYPNKILFLVTPILSDLIKVIPQIQSVEYILHAFKDGAYLMYVIKRL